ncbi:MAG TPA: fluoride efflux transporter CrcB [Solirubrobacteraceae bacterium]|nr:fluoride efflux transporter CrcB [Solirubrobacteraceae bacterium]
MPELDREEMAAIFVGGAAGSLLRVWIAQTVTSPVTAWPWATFIVNVTGCFALALIATHLRERPPESPHWHPLLGTGFCGAYTTFSTMQLETLRMFDHDRFGLALGYVVASVMAGYLAIGAGAALLRRVHQARGARREKAGAP